MDLVHQSTKAKLELRRSLQVVPVSETELYLYSATGTSYHLKHEGKNLLQIVSALTGGVTWEELASYIDSKDSSDLEVAQQLILDLIELGVLQRIVTPTGLTSAEIERFDRTIGYLGNFETSEASRYDYMRRLRNAHVLMLGIGSLGSWALQHLVACGVGYITGVDMDNIESSNLARQSLYGEADIDELKVKVAASAVKALSSFTKFFGVERQITCSKDILDILKQAGTVDLIILTADKPVWKISCWAASAALASGVPLLRGNRLGIGPLMLPGQTACPGCAWPRLVDQIPNTEQMVEYQRCLQRRPVAALSTQLAMSGALLIQEAIAYLSGAGSVRTYNSLLSVNSSGYEGITISPFPRDPRCSVCGN